MRSPIDDMEPEAAPSWFWSLIEHSEGDLERLRELATALTREQLEEAFAYYRMLASYVMTDELEEDRAFDLANWIVAQGKGLYFSIYEKRAKPPREAPTRRGAGSWGMLAEVYWDRFGKEIV
jgi:hypothetical protein